MEQCRPAGALSPYRVLDLSDEKGLLCGRILADLGADTLVVEPIAGNHARKMGPFYHDVPHPERSLFWFAFNTNKRSITLNLESADGGALFKRLAASADFVIESYPPGYMDSLGLGYEALSRLNPSIVMTSITPFGQTGPYRGYAANDLTLMAMGGLTYISGEPDRPPLRIPVPQAYLHAGSWAAAGTMVAFHGRQVTGEGQHVDVSIHQAAAWSTYVTPEWWSYAGRNLKREGTWRQIGLARIRLIFACRDGHVVVWLLGGVGAPRGQWRMAEQMEAEGTCPNWLKGFDWSQLDVSAAPQSFFDDLSEAVAGFVATKEKMALFDWARENELFLAPVSNARDLLANPQLKYRGFWVELEYPEIGESITHLGAFANMGETPIAVTRRAPLTGEHNLEIYRDELGFSVEELAALKEAGVI